jgi:hypothetical protein
MSLSACAPPAFVGPVAVPAAAVLAVIELHLNGIVNSLNF